MADVSSIFDNPLYTISEKTNATGNNRLDKEAFLKLLTAQLKYQDPLNPLKDTEFMGQLTAMTTLEQIINMKSTLEDLATYQIYSNALMIGSTIIGKTVITTDGTEYTVKGIAIEEGKLKINVGESYINMSQIKEIKA
ncbi:Flagellar basal-body rod modification protein FlgD [Thermodesulfovibrio sp. N1]|uniref:flagellar hook assembly protein FlgD n=1 Tax=unclassified Thermodesulfovibrio TaxID=2645936 RepID=UPI00083B0D03|nr:MULTISPECIES: flagellar hook capping FlgD N-terminal domain-containing protein [unclassified Thermodesulfovibrio]MDI1470943.1 flagellar hook capping FlgD N-terminal domain-containing protein [Thermodesulfovibrio sp. 1176]ODA45135.1 Flagellar basal-body rod modification protein FlgD [Thermodesulfovibrio sp. N1]